MTMRPDYIPPDPTYLREGDELERVDAGLARVEKLLRESIAMERRRIFVARCLLGLSVVLLLTSVAATIWSAL
jgi:hypothetical protein